MIVSRKMALGAAIPFLLVLLPLSLGQPGSISDHAAYLEQLDAKLQALHVTEITYNPDGSVAKTVTIDPAGPNKRTVIYNSDGTKNVIVQTGLFADNNALSYQLDKNGVIIPGTKTVLTIPNVTPTPTPDTGSDIIVVTPPAVSYRYCETTGQWEEVKSA